MTGSGGAGRRPPRPEAGFESWSQGANNARARIAEGVVVPQGAARFRLGPEARVFVIGPWFGRAIEAGLGRLGVRVTSVDPDSPLVEIRRNPALGLLDQTNPATIRQELDWAAGRIAFQREALIPFGDLFVDPHLHERAPHGAADGLMARRAAIGAHFAGAFAADLVVLVLDTVEAWFDRRSRLALYGPPLQRLYDAEPDRFGYRRLAFEECQAHLRAATALLHRRNPRQKVVLVVSPVPLERTFGKEDVIVANQIAKSTLHAAATAIAAAAEAIDYFPAYEAVVTSDPARAWMADRRSVQDGMMRAVTRAFVERYGLRLAPDSRTAGTA